MAGIKIRRKGDTLDFIELLINKGIACIGTVIWVQGVYVNSAIHFWGGLILTILGLTLNIEISVPEREERFPPKK